MSNAQGPTASRRGAMPMLLARAPLAIVPLALALVVSLAGCGPSKVAECSELNKKINEGVDKIEKATTGKGDQETNPADLKAMADTMDKIADDLSKTKTTIPELKDFSKKYQDMSKNIGKAARDMAGALEAKDAEKATKAQASLEAATQPEEALVESINKFCEAP